MRYFELDLNHIPQINIFGKENLVPPRNHRTRYAPENIIYVITDGELFLEESGNNIHLKKGDVYFFKKGDFQKPLKSTDCSYFYIHFKTESLKEFNISDNVARNIVSKKNIDFLKAAPYSTDRYNHLKALVKQKISIEDTLFYENVVNTLESIYKSRLHSNPKYYLDISHTTSHLMMKLENYCIEQRNTKTEKSVNIHYTARKIAGYIEENFTCEITSQSIEKEFFINYDYANRIFKKSIGMSINKYRNFLRINKAKADMLTTDKTISQIADDVGFYDKAHFFKQFKALEGISPGEYRKKIMSERI